MLMLSSNSRVDAMESNHLESVANKIRHLSDKGLAARLYQCVLMSDDTEALQRLHEISEMVHVDLSLMLDLKVVLTSRDLINYQWTHIFG
jgi:hypothetical protein